MRRMILLAGLVLAVGVFLPASAHPAVGGSELPLKASLTGHGTLNLVTGQVHTLWSGQGSHLGRTQLEEFAQLVPTGPGTFAVSGTLTATAASGDELFLTTAGTVTTADGMHFTFSVHTVLNGGTGRFEDASASYDATGHAMIVSVEGAIAMTEFEATVTGQLSW